MSEKFTVSRYFHGKGGTTRSERVSMHAYTWDTAVKKATGVHWGFVCRLGSNTPLFVSVK